MPFQELESDTAPGDPFTMSRRRIRLVNGPYDGLEVDDDPKSEILWVYNDRYGHVLAVRAGRIPRRPTMAAYVVMPGRAEALHGAT